MKKDREAIGDLLRALASTRFSDIVKNFDLKPATMAGSAAPRSVVEGSVFTANESPPEASIPFHHEMAQTPNPPAFVFFYCERTALEGGATPLVRLHLLPACEQEPPNRKTTNTGRARFTASG